jgi:hypothetical protein
MENGMGASTMKTPVAVMLIALLAVTAACEQQPKQPSNQTLHAQIGKDLPAGSSVETVEAWLAAHDLSHSDVIDNAALAHMGRDAGTYELRTLIRGPAPLALVRTDTQIVFVFDRGRRLLESRVAPAHTGL